MRRHHIYSYLLAILDWTTVVGSLVAAIVLRGRDFHGSFIVVGAPMYAEILFLGFYGVIVTLVFHYFGLYRVDVYTTVLEHTVRIVKALLLSVLGIGILAFFVRANFIVNSRLAIIYFTVLCFTLMLGGRVVLFRAMYMFFTRHRVFRRRAVVLGAGETGKNAAINVMLNPHLGVDVIGFLDDTQPVGQVVFSGAKVIGTTAEVKSTVRVLGADEILLCVDNMEQARFFDLLEACLETGVAVKVSSPLYGVIPARLDIEKYGKVGVVGVSQFGPTPAYERYKRAFDSVVAAFGLLLLSPVFAVIALAVKFDSRGPVFFTQTRIGRDGKPFQFIKFRSMTAGGTDEKSREDSYAKLIRGEWKGAEGDAMPTKIVDEARVTRSGKFLRRTSLDELPQLLNVLRGDMSLVGPRPCLPYEWKHYEEWHKKRLSVTPGCTGVWQVFGRSEVGFQDMVILDLFYSQNASLGLDILLLLKTIPVMVFGRGGR
jgi:undecaprenyl-phosphate galactose phosphotransferase